LNREYLADRVRVSGIFIVEGPRYRGGRAIHVSHGEKPQEPLDHFIFKLMVHIFYFSFNFYLSFLLTSPIVFTIFTNMRKRQGQRIGRRREGSESVRL